MKHSDPKKTTNISKRVSTEFKTEFKSALDHLGLTEAFFIQSTAEALIHLVKSGGHLALPVRLQTVPAVKKKTGAP